jgi:hypothetical protein
VECANSNPKITKCARRLPHCDVTIFVVQHGAFHSWNNGFRFGSRYYLDHSRICVSLVNILLASEFCGVKDI